MNVAVRSDLVSKTVNTDQDPKFAIIGIHGWKGDENSFDPIVKLMNFNNVKWYLPKAPYLAKWNNEKGNSWFDGNESIGWKHEKSFSGMRSLLEKIIKEGFSRKKIFIMGFSQGACLAIEFGLRLPFSLGGIIPIAGFIKYKDRLETDLNIKSKNTPILLMHGNEDDIIPVSAGKTASEVLYNLGFQIHFETYDLGHKIPLNKKKLIYDFINNPIKTINSKKNLLIPNE